MGKEILLSEQKARSLLVEGRDRLTICRFLLRNLELGLQANEIQTGMGEFWKELTPSRMRTEQGKATGERIVPGKLRLELGVTAISVEDRVRKDHGTYERDELGLPYEGGVEFANVNIGITKETQREMGVPEISGNGSAKKVTIFEAERTPHQPPRHKVVADPAPSLC